MPKVKTPSASKKSENGKISKFINKQRTLIFSSRGIKPVHRHLMKDLVALLPHAKTDAKFDGKKNEYTHVNEVCELKKCPNCIFFEHRGNDLYCYMLKTPNGPTMKFKVMNVSTMKELKLTGNCLKYSRPILHFDSNFEKEPQFKLMRELLTQIFASPKGHPKTKPFTDHIFGFYIVDGKIWFRNYQIVDRLTGTGTKNSLVEIGPRFVLDPIRILSGSFDGDIIYNNDSYVSSREISRYQREAVAIGKQARQEQKLKRRELMNTFKRDEVHSVWFDAHSEQKQHARTVSENDDIELSDDGEFNDDESIEDVDDE